MAFPNHSGANQGLWSTRGWPWRTSPRRL